MQIGAAMGIAAADARSREIPPIARLELYATNAAALLMPLEPQMAGI